MANDKGTHVRRELVISRVFSTDIETLFDSWTDPEQVGSWWGSRAFTNVVYDWEARPGGRIHLGMTAPCGTIYLVKGSFHEVNEPERLLFTSRQFEDEQGLAQLEVLHTAIFTRFRSKARLTLQAVVIRSTPAIDDLLDGMEPAWKQSLDKLAEHLGTLMRSANNKTDFFNR